ncbi:Guanine nucleotide-binding-like protein 1 [Entomortierella lignicola]|nr:Guanine nucleotide-binding-like protein 1 [Entomortierella lignicola]
MPRAKPFSGALKKKQLQEKRARLHNKLEERQRDERPKDSFQADNSNNKPSGDPYGGRFVKGYSKQFKPESFGVKATARENSNHSAEHRLRSVFIRRSAVEIENSRRESMQPLRFLPESELEVSFEEMFPEVIGFPKRPKWDYSMSREELEKNETKMFEAWMDSIYNRYPEDELSYFEHNLEVWRQLHPVIHFPPSLYNYVVKDMNRKLVVVFNKVDLVAPNTLYAWKHYFKEKFPELHIASFSCYPPDPTLLNDSSTGKYSLRLKLMINFSALKLTFNLNFYIAALQRVVKRPRRRFYNAVGVKDVLVACKDVELSKNGDQVDWDALIAMHDTGKEAEFQESEGESDQHSEGEDNDSDEKNDKVNLLDKQNDQGLAAKTLQTVNIEDDERGPHKDYVTIGLVGHPNVGKSSLINSIMGRTVVSTSRTPGHTKHFQTIHLTHNVRLCDSPGLVFPSLLPKPLQILSGMYPIAQVQEPYSVVQYLAMRVNIPRLLKLDPPPSYERGPFRWSAFAICESFALQRGFLTAKAGHPDVYRAANAILRLANDGRILLSFKPPGFFTSTKYEQLRVAEVDASVTTEDEHQSQGKEHIKDDNDADSDELDLEDQDEEDVPGDKGSKFRVNTRIGGFFGLLQDDEDDGDDDDDDEEEEEEDEE